MTSQILAAELANLISDSKRKNTELRNAAEKALQDLKSLPNTSEAQVAADLSRRPHFISPFLIACSTHHAKFTSTALSCLQRLSVARALPRERLTEVLDAFKESVTSSHDIQLKILQALPSLLQNYPAEIRGELLSTVFQICSGLQNSKNPAVSNTAAATLQQLVITVFDRVAVEDDKALEIPTVTEVKGDDGNVSVRPAANDAYKVFNDLNLLVTGEKPTFIRFSSIPSASTLELIETVLSNHGRIMTEHPEQVHILRALLMPLIIRSLSDRLSFPITVRVIRILNLILRNHLTILPSECEIALGLLNHMLDPEASQTWKRALCLEVFRGIYADSRLLLAIYSQFDATEGKKGIFQDNLASFVRLAIEKPALIGLGQQSSVPSNFGDSNTSDQAEAEAGTIAGVIGGPVGDRNTNSRPLGISSQWSVLKTPCMEHLDKTEPPSLPDTYIYSLVLTCITNISESLAKFVLPLTVHHESKRKKKNDDPVAVDTEAGSPEQHNRRLSRTHSFRKKTIPVNPLDLDDHPAYVYIQTSLTLVTECWPAVLATCSTFLNAALDVEYYRALVRAIQKFTQVSGLLRLSTPRDAFLTTLGKAAVPSNLLLTNLSSPKSATAEQRGILSNAKGLLGVEAASANNDKSRRASHDMSSPTLGPRNLLCLRALLNLAIALGPTLQSAWSIVFETLQVADLVLALANQSAGRGSGQRADQDGSTEKIEAETVAVQAAARRLFESTVDYPNEPFTEVLQALCALLNGGSSSEPDESTGPRPQVLQQRRLGSVSGLSLNTDTNSRDSAFALNKIGELAALNEARLSQYDPAESGWDILIAEVVHFSADHRRSMPSRLLAADILSRTVREIAEISMYDEQREQIQARILSALQHQISALHRGANHGKEAASETEIRVHQIALDALKSVIEQCGESLVAGWSSVLDSLLSIFLSSESEGKTTSDSAGSKHQSHEAAVIARSLARSAFATVHLVCSDFMASVPDACLATLLELLLKFSCQQEDLNMSLTAITYFWNVSDFLQSRSDLSSLLTIVGDIQEQDKIRSIVSANSQEGTTSTLWLQVLLHLSTITTDKRAEVRNSATQTIQRIFENYADQLTPEAWMLCLRVVLFGTVEANLAVQKDIRNNESSAEVVKGWNETTRTVLQSITVLSIACVGKLEDASKFGDAWEALLDLLQQYFVYASHALGSFVFATITGVLSGLESTQTLGISPLLKTAAVWKTYFDSRDEWKEDNQEAFLAYADAFKVVYQLAGRSLDAELPSMLSNLEACVVGSDEVAYSSDLDNMTAVQTRVLECVSMVNTETPGLSSYTIELLSRFVVLPYDAFERRPEKRGPTFVALAKASMTTLQSVVIKHVKDKEIYTSAFNTVLKNLSRPIQEKYSWQREGKAPALWQKATTTVITILESGLQQVQAQGLSTESLEDVWCTLISIARYITRANLSATDPLPASLVQDEEFDIKALEQLRDLITLPLGSPSIPDSLRQTYALNLFTASLIHPPHPSELPTLTTAPLSSLHIIRLGQTAPLPSTPRPNMSYTCTRELFRLASRQSSTRPQIALAQAACPYAILRATLPLKTYIADHPLRGRMPVPHAQRAELLLLLRLLADLEAEPDALPHVVAGSGGGGGGVPSEGGKKHLFVVYPLVGRALGVARGDEGVFEALRGLLEGVEGAFKVGV